MLSLFALFVSYILGGVPERERNRERERAERDKETQRDKEMEKGRRKKHVSRWKGVENCREKGGKSEKDGGWEDPRPGLPLLFVSL